MKRTSPKRATTLETRKATEPKPLFALVSQILVAFTVELDNEFERRMADAGYPGAGLSWNVYSRVLKFVPPDGVTVENLSEHSPLKSNPFALGCLERWHFIVLDPGDGPAPRRVVHKQSGRQLRDGWGSGRGIRKEWIVRATAKGQKAIEIWPPLFDEIEGRWRKRFGEGVIGRLRETLVSMASKLDLRSGLSSNGEEDEAYPLARSVTADGDADSLPLPQLLAVLLYAFSVEFGAECKVPLALCANAIRVLGEGPAPAAQIPRLTGASKEQVAIGWRWKRFIEEGRDPHVARGKLASLNPLGESVYKKYRRVIAEIESRWKEKFPVRELRGALEEVLTAGGVGGLRIIEGLTPPAGVARAGMPVAALGRRQVASASRQRGRDLVEQTEWFLEDPAGALPWFPLWDMNRGFGV
jgi:hypothetical protein